MSPDVRALTLEGGFGMMEKRIESAGWREKGRRKMDALEKRILQVIEEHAEQIKAFGRDVFHHAELGYKEYRTAEKFAA